ncbi:MAG TPA: 23S rRNA (guanosine(2251)-2'-O)-methyltransferase RlmB [Clostridiaceae bacterium]|nr:23S rRNA (guanosine(2251)-2'-O)-methyltransferase RlmB [Clostridiaceae bacterium]
MRKKDLGSNKTSRAKPASKGKKNRSEVTKKGTGKRPGIKGHDKDAAGAVKNTRIFNEVDSIEREDRVEGKNSVFEAIRSGRPLNKLFVEKDSQDVLVLRIIAMAREKDIPIQYLERNKLDSISQTRAHQGVILELAAKEYVEVEDILGTAEGKGEKPFVLALDGITDTNNLGSIIRSAECAGVHGIILPKRRSAALNATVAKVAAGALEYVNVARVTNLVQTLRALKNEGLWVIGADMDGEANFQDANLTGPIALVIGSEGEGLARLVKNECDMLVKIPMKGKISSLNAGVAAGLVMFEILRQRGY